MILGHDDAQQFFRLLDELIVEIGVTYQIGEHPMDSPLATDEDRYDVLSAIAEEPIFIDSFIENTKIPLSKEDLSVLDQWRHLWKGTFYLVDFAPNGNALLSTSIGMVEVCGLTQEIRTLGLEVPNIYRAVLMPFKNHIVSVFIFIGHPIILDSGVLNVFQRDVEENQKKPVIRLAADFISKYDIYREGEKQKDWEELQRKLHREYDKAHGEELLPEGMHKGVLAGLSDEEREAVVKKRLEENGLEFQEVILRAFLNEIVKKPVKTSLPEALADLAEADLIQAAYRIGLELPRSLTKQKMIDTICEVFSEKADPDVSMEGLMSFVSRNDYCNFRDVVDNGGSIVVSDDDPIVLMYSPCPPYFFTYWSQEQSQVTISVMPEVMQHYHKLDSDALETARAINEIICFHADTCVDYYGIVSFKEFMQIAADSVGVSSLPLDPTLNSLLAGDASRFYGFTLTTLGNDLYICDPSLSLELNRFDDEEGKQALLNYQAHLIQRHAQMPRRPIKQIMEQGSVFEYVIELDSAKALRKWIDAHIPDGVDDLMFADAVLGDIIESAKGPLDPYAVPDLLEFHGLLVDDVDVSDELLTLAVAFVNDIPIWENNGYSPEEVRLRSGGKPIFRNEEGLPRKIGRNEPCPCGSGKKYKKCCGR